MHSTDLVSVVIPAYNAAAYLGAAVASALNQTYGGKLEVIVVDDGSTDNTPRVVSDFEAEITYLRQEHRGPGAARNQGLQYSRGAFIAFLDADDQWLPEKLQRQMEVMFSRPEVGLVCCDFRRVSERGVIAPSNKQLAQPASGWVFEQLWQRNFISTPTVVVRRDCLTKAGLFDESLPYSEDWHLWVRIARYFQVHYLDAPLVSVRSHPASLSASDPDMRLGAYLAAMEKLVRLFPELAPSARGKRARAYFDNGWRHLTCGNRHLARRRFRAALTESRGMARAYAYLLATYVPGAGFSWLRAVGRRLLRCAPPQGFLSRPRQ